MALRLYLHVLKAPRREENKNDTNPDHARGTLREQGASVATDQKNLTTEEEIVLNDESFAEILVQEEQGREMPAGQAKKTESPKTHNLDRGKILNKQLDPVVNTIPQKKEVAAKTQSTTTSGKKSELRTVTSHHVKPFTPKEHTPQDSRQFKELRAEHLISEFDLILKNLAAADGNTNKGYELDAKTLLGNSGIDSAELLEITNLNDLAHLAVQRLNKLLSEDEDVKLVFQTVERRKRTGAPPPTIPLDTARQVAALTMISHFAIDADSITRDIAKNQK